MEEIENVLKNDGASKASARLYLNEEFADVNFLFEIDEEIQKVPANKIVLAVLSPVFNAMFFGPNKETGDVKIVDATIDTFKEFLQFFYLNNVTIAMENIEGVVRLADKYDVLEHVNASAVLLENELTLENMCWGYQLALMLDNETLKQFCEKHISAYPDDIFKSATFQRCDQIVLKHILLLNSMACREFEVLDACLVWAKYSCNLNNVDENNPLNLKAQLGECFSLIRFGAMKSEEFATHSILHREMFTAEELADILYATTVKKFKSSKFVQEPRNDHNYNKENPSCLELQRPILINPDKTYEISWEVVNGFGFGQNNSSDYYYYYSSNENFTLTGGITVKMKNQYPYCNTGLISRLCFNRL
ncbi:BTB/POZ domain-containing protein 3-like [Sitodiplosis mosellana]|uniref:BTB/POZ domain-containing protein 3-like n=1 Tax=Sitodiplosis mosellana TaxID=263140 RepID=UPI002444FC36|nr:BTB/POZ domain-containing protein 3-like [Sitodiplosis mosellana]